MFSRSGAILKHRADESEPEMTLSVLKESTPSRESNQSETKGTDHRKD